MIVLTTFGLTSSAPQVNVAINTYVLAAILSPFDTSLIEIFFDALAPTASLVTGTFPAANFQSETASV